MAPRNCSAPGTSKQLTWKSRETIKQLTPVCTNYLNTHFSQAKQPVEVFVYGSDRSSHLCTKHHTKHNKHHTCKNQLLAFFAISVSIKSLTEVVPDAAFFHLITYKPASTRSVNSKILTTNTHPKYHAKPFPSPAARAPKQLLNYPIPKITLRL